MAVIKDVGTAVLAFCVGLFVWCFSLEASAQSLLLLIPILWACTSSRQCAGSVVIFYLLGATWFLPSGVSNYFDTSWVTGLFLWLFAAFFLALPAFVIWHRNRVIRVYRVPALLLLWIIPPFGLVGWAHPLTGVGWLFPGFSWWGIVAGVMFMMMVSWPMDARIRGIICACVFIFSYNTNVRPEKPEGWYGHDSFFSFRLVDQPHHAGFAGYERHMTLIDLMSGQSDVKVHVFPEWVVGQWNDHATWLWRHHLQGSNEVI
jgi:hypothetical protein